MTPWERGRWNWRSRVVRVTWEVRLRFRPRDLWVGAYVGELEWLITTRNLRTVSGRARTLYVCPLPMVCLEVTRSEWDG